MKEETGLKIIKLILIILMFFAFYILLTTTEEAVHARIFQYYGCENTTVVINNFFTNGGCYATCLEPHNSSETELLGHSINDIMFFFMRFILYLTTTILIYKEATKEW